MFLVISLMAIKNTLKTSSCVELGGERRFCIEFEPLTICHLGSFARWKGDYTYRFSRGIRVNLC